MRQQIIFITKSGTYSEKEVIKAFLDSDSLEDVKSVVEKSEDRIYAGWASVEARDKAGEIIPITDVINQQEILLRRGGTITDEHTNAVIGKTLAYKVLEHPKTKTYGVLHLNKIYKDNPLDDKVWAEIKTGKRKGSSVGGMKTGARLINDENGMLTKVLTGFHQYETASVYNPCNPFALNEAVSVVAKSSYKEENSTGENIMVEENKIVKEAKEEVQEEKPKEDVEKVDVAKEEESEDKEKEKSVDKAEDEKEDSKEDDKKEEKKVDKQDEPLVEEETEEQTDVSQNDAITALSEQLTQVNERFTAIDNRVDLLEEKFSGAPKDEEVIEKAEEGDKDDKPQEKMNEDESEVSKLEKKVLSQEEEISQLKKSLAKNTISEVVKSDRPAEKVIEEPSPSNEMEKVHKKFQNNEITWSEAENEFRNILKN